MSEHQQAGGTPDAKSDAKRQAALKGAPTQIEKQFGKGTVMRMGDPGAWVAVDAIPTGALSLDIALGIGGVPRGRIVEIFGPESSGKTTLVYHILAEAQKPGGVCAFIDAEHAMDPIYARQIGLDIDELLVSQPDYGWVTVFNPDGSFAAQFGARPARPARWRRPLRRCPPGPAS